ncbi:glucose/quinate/shikimate family membrane-bound PQQ-dependent dehydrogenase [Aquabacterium sp. A7-Y]|uniref:glucose/quinate/shikimate family membrane-bound PQQ-dependent dehydrogenase n=1 Tax=Aquabacterium sp. A7-Y TaxID=1349605 RepID=UPI00223D5587|nr:glucose/quinate/shikimate family membrane-bound PQQ-dependent dehydrogenase [Aquabacterium sp. A7-Y]MCW7537944.1 glucose/quinate/shikimate family membrane-bound PQQ-dependent dehydrogenase [Aquabacterium sp. A7-Y]
MSALRPSLLLRVTGLLIALMGIGLVAGGAWLIALGGSWYYLVAGLAFVLGAWLLARGRSAALWVFAAVVGATLAWGLWEAGLDWWPLAARVDVPFLIGLFLITPWVNRRLTPPSRPQALGVAPPADPARPGWHGGRLALAAVLVLFALVALASWMVDPHRIEGTLAQATTPRPGDDGLGVPAGEWHAYGRTGHGQRYSLLDQITPDNVGRLDVAWTYRTGDMRGRPGDPHETTFEVTPLKIGNKLVLCTPHQSVIALDATTGQQLWRYDPQIQGRLALQHLTCRGLSYLPPTAAVPAASASVPAAGVAAAPVDASSATGTAAETQARPPQPVAAAHGKTSASCTAQLFMPTADGRVIALNPDDGSVCTAFGGGTGQIDLWAGMPHVRPGSYYSTSPVVVTDKVLIVGGTVLDNVTTHEPSGVIRAFDVRTGALVWNWDPGKPDDTAPLPAGRTYTPSSPNSWSISSVDTALGLVYVPMGNQPPDQWGGRRSEAVERYASSVVALDLATGRVRWHFQTVHHDLWDYDVPAQPSLVDLTIQGQVVPALVQPTKQGELFVLDRRTGRPLLPVTEVPAPQGAAEGDRTAPTQPRSALSFDPPPLEGRHMWGATLFDQLGCRIALHRLRYEGRYTPPSLQGTLVYPGNFGVFNWGGIAVDPQRQIAFTTPTYLAFVSQLVPRADDKTLYVQGEGRPDDSLPALNENFGAPFAVKLSAFTSPFGLPCQAPPWGYVAAADLTTGRVIWQHKNGTVRDSSPLPLPFQMGVPNLGGPIVTAGGVAFLSGTLDYYVRAYDLRNGEQLWQHRLPAGGQATPMTYTGADGRQYVVVVAGGHGSLGTKAGDHVIAYALPKP